MEELEQKYDELRKAIEKTLGCEFRTPKDFDLLSLRLFNLTHNQVSAPTLRRFWGYQERGMFTPRRFTLNALAMIAGFKSWDAFCEKQDMIDAPSSDYIHNAILTTASLIQGDRIRIIWQPDRNMTAKYIGQDLFVVESCVNCKLKENDTFHCGVFIENEPLVLHSIIRVGSLPLNYICGKNGGIKFTLISEKAFKGGVIPWIPINYTYNERYRTALTRYW